MSEQDFRRYVGIDQGEPWPAYAWPGGYAIAYLADDSELICPNCMNTQSEIHFDGDDDGWKIVAAMAFGADTDYPDHDERCAHCNAIIEEALT